MCSLKRLVLSPHHLPPFHSHYFTSLLWTMVLLLAILSYRRSPNPHPTSLSLSLSFLLKSHPNPFPNNPIAYISFSPFMLSRATYHYAFSQKKKKIPIPTNEPLVFYTYTLIGSFSMHVPIQWFLHPYILVQSLSLSLSLSFNCLVVYLDIMLL